jgi:hypothetical protein
MSFLQQICALVHSSLFFSILRVLSFLHPKHHVNEGIISHAEHLGMFEMFCYCLGFPVLKVQTQTLYLSNLSKGRVLTLGPSFAVDHICIQKCFLNFLETFQKEKSFYDD